MPGIETLQSYEGSRVAIVMLRWMGMNICLVKILGFDGKKYLHVIPEDAVSAEPITNWRVGKWIMSKEDVVHKDVRACITSSGFVPDTIEKNITESHD